MWLKRAPLGVVRALVLVLNVPPLVVSLKSYNIIQLFLVANLITATSAMPVLAGLIRHPLVLPCPLFPIPSPHCCRCCRCKPCADVNPSMLA